MSRQAVSKWERNEAMPEAEKIVRISRQFGVSTDYLLLEELEEPETPKAPIPAAGPWDRVKRWYRNKGYLLAWVLVAWGVWNGWLDLAGSCGGSLTGKDGTSRIFLEEVRCG